MNDSGMSRRRFLGVGIGCGSGYDSSSVMVLPGSLVLCAYRENAAARGR
jgi:hypothetical protein